MSKARLVADRDIADGSITTADLANNAVTAAKIAANTVVAPDSYVVAGKNFMVNGGFDVWARGTSFASPIGLFTADRFRYTRSASKGGVTVSRQASTLPNLRWAFRVQRNAGNTDSDATFVGYAWESADVVQWQGKQVTFSFYARRGANFSDVNSSISLSWYSGTGNDQGTFIAHDNESSRGVFNYTVTTTWQRFTTTVTIPSNASSSRIDIGTGYSGTAGADDWYEITGIQLELGSVATPFSRAGGTLQGELAACQRYYERIDMSGTFAGAAFGTGNSSTRINKVVIPMRVSKRANPSVSFTGIYAYDGNANYLPTSIGNISSRDAASVDIIVSGGGLVQFRPYSIGADASVSPAFIEISAEL